MRFLQTKKKPELSVQVFWLRYGRSCGGKPVLFAQFDGVPAVVLPLDFCDRIIGLKWDAIDFERGTITVKHTVTYTERDGKKILIQSDKAKTNSSLRTMPLVDSFRDRLCALKEQQKENKRVCGNCYNYKYDGYVFVDEMGNLFEPNWVTQTFGNLLKKHELRQIRFHDLRHSCASLMLANGVPMKQMRTAKGAA